MDKFGCFCTGVFWGGDELDSHRKSNNPHFPGFHRLQDSHSISSGHIWARLSCDRHPGLFAVFGVRHIMLFLLFLQTECWWDKGGCLQNKIGWVIGRNSGGQFFTKGFLFRQFWGGPSRGSKTRRILYWGGGAQEGFRRICI